MQAKERLAEYARIQSVHGVNFSGWFHHYSEALFLRASSVLGEGNVAIDAGCYVGDNAFAMAEYVGDSGRVLTFEPDPRLRQRMQTRLTSGAPYAGRISLLSVALGKELGEASFVIVNELEGHSGLRVKKQYGRDVTHYKIQVPVCPLDDVVETASLSHDRIKLIKFDLEGGELDALRGAEKTITLGRPLIMFEYGNLDSYGHRPADFVDFFNRHGYAIVDAFDFGLPTDIDLASTIGWNMFAVPREDSRVRVMVSDIVATAK